MSGKAKATYPIKEGQGERRDKHDHHSSIFVHPNEHRKLSTSRMPAPTANAKDGSALLLSGVAPCARPPFA